MSNPTAFVLLGCNDDVTPSIWVEKEYYYDTKDPVNGPKTVSEYVYDLLTFLSDYPVKNVYVDPSALAFKVEVKKTLPYHPIGRTSLPLIDAKNDVKNGITALQAHMVSGDLKILRSCKNLIQEIQSYTWDPKRSEKGFDEPIKKYDHAIDALRYAVYTEWGNKLSIKQKTQQDRNIELWNKMQAMNSPWVSRPPQQRGMQIIRPRR
jgi:hypothetical protein